MAQKDTLTKRQIVNPSSDLLDGLLEEFEGECRRALKLMEALRAKEPPSEQREELEADLSASISRFTWLAKDVLREWDKVIESLPD
jgi:hypothetical protein